MTRAMRVTIVVALSIGVLSAPLTARAAERCDLLDVSCALDPVTDPISDPVEDPVDDIVEAVDEVVDPAEDELDPVIDPIVGPVKEIVNDVLGGGGTNEPPGGGSTPGPGTGSGPGGAGRDDVPGFQADPALDPLTAVREAATSDISAARGVRPWGRGAGGGLGGMIDEAIAGAAVLLILASITVGFVLLQDRLDRGDPKLAVAPLRPEVVRFE